MAKLNWDTAPHDYHLGVDRGVLYLQKPDGTYENGVAWNGIRTIVETPTGGTVSKIYADNMQYGSLRASEGLNGRIEVYDYPADFALCNGLHEPIFGMRINLQKRRSFGLCYRTMINQKDYLLHVIYGINLNPGEYQHTPIGASAEPTVFGWEFFTIPAKYKDLNPAASVVIDTRKVSSEQIKYFEDILYGTEDTNPRLPSFAELLEEAIAYEIRPLLVHAVETLNLWIWDTFYFPDDSVPRAVHREADTRVIFGLQEGENVKRPGVTYVLQYADRDIYKFLVTADAKPSEHSSMLDTIEDIPNTTLIRTRPSTDGYVFYDYSIIFEEET